MASTPPQYRPGVFGGSLPGSSQTEQLRALIPVFALVVAIVAAVTDPQSAADLTLAGLAVGAFAVWAYVPDVPLAGLSFAVLCPVVVAQRSGQLEPLLFEASLLGFVVGRWAPSLAAAVALALLAAVSPVVASLIQDPSEIAVGIWIMGVAFPWALGRAAARQGQLAAQLDATRRELAQQALLAERRQIARDVHDFVGHGLAAVMLQITSARHVLRRDPAAAEEALLSAEEVGRRSMHELRRTVALLRSDDEAAVAPQLPSTGEITALVDHARQGDWLSSCGREATSCGSRRASGWRSTGSARRLSRTRLGTRRTRARFSRSRWRRGGRGSSPRRPDRRSPKRLPSRSDRATAWSGCGSARPRSAASSPPGRPPRVGG